MIDKSEEASLEILDSVRGRIPPGFETLDVGIDFVCLFGGGKQVMLSQIHPVHIYIGVSSTKA